MDTIRIEKKVDAPKFEYQAFQHEKIIASIKGHIINDTIRFLHSFESSNKDNDSLLVNKIGDVLYADCKETNTQILIGLNEKTKRAKWFMDQSNFELSYTNYVYEHSLENLKKPAVELALRPFKDIPLVEFQTAFYNSLLGNERFNKGDLTPDAFFEAEKEEIKEIWNEDLMFLAYHIDGLLGILCLRTGKHPKTKELEGMINYLGIVPQQRNKGLGKSLHLKGLSKLKTLGCKSYFGGTTSNNAKMLSVFESNDCKRTGEQVCFQTK